VQGLVHDCGKARQGCGKIPHTVHGRQDKHLPKDNGVLPPKTVEKTINAIHSFFTEPMALKLSKALAPWHIKIFFSKKRALVLFLLFYELRLSINQISTKEVQNDKAIQFHGNQVPKKRTLPLDAGQISEKKELHPLLRLCHV
jgi:hypothetical protein